MIEDSSITGDGMNCLIQTRISFVGVIQAMCVGMDLLVSVSFGDEKDPYRVTVGQLTTTFALTKVETVVELFPCCPFDDSPRLEQKEESKKV